MFIKLISLPILGMLFCGVNQPPNLTRPYMVDSKPKVILVNAISEEIFDCANLRFNDDFREVATEALEDVALYKTQSCGSFKKAIYIPQSNKDSADVQLQLDVNLEYDFSRVTMKKKTGYNVLANSFTFKFKYLGQIEIMPTAYLVVRDPKTQNLLDRIELSLDEVSVTISTKEASQYNEIEATLYTEELKGLSDVIDSGVEEIGEQLNDELAIQFLNQQFLTKLSNQYK